MPEHDNKTLVKNMSTKNNDRIVQPYLSFEGRCEEAVEFYREALGQK